MRRGQDGGWPVRIGASGSWWRRAGSLLAVLVLVAMLGNAGAGAIRGSGHTAAARRPICPTLLQPVPLSPGGLGMQGGVRTWLDPAHHRLRALAYLVIGNGTRQPLVRLELRSLAIERGLLRVRGARAAGRVARTTLTSGPNGSLAVPLPCRLRPGAGAIVVLDLIVGLPDELGHGRWRLSSDGARVVASGWLPQPTKGIHPWLAVEAMAPIGASVVMGPVERQEDAVVAALPGGAVTERVVGDVTVRVLAPAGTVGAEDAAAVFGLATDLLPWLEARLGPMERPVLTVALLPSTGQAWTWPGIIWLPDRLRPDWIRIYLVHELVHEWFGGIVTGDSTAQPVAMEAPAELVARLYLDRFRECTCPGLRLDLPRTAYGRCFYDAVYLDAALRLDGVRRELGDDAFWAALRSVLAKHRGETIGSAQLLEALGRPHLFGGRTPAP